MCGIAGVLGTNPSNEQTRIVSLIIDSQRRRGPDFQKVEAIPGPRTHAVLGHNRLSIIDLSPEANQPMWDHSRRYAIVFNGEIYNHVELRESLVNLGHRFLTRSDTEVILEAYKAWGTDAVDRLRGMFAFGIYDSAQGRLWLCRDRFGKKPLVYHLGSDTLWFASTGRVIAQQLGLAPDAGYVARGLRYLLFDDDSARSQYERLTSLPPGHWLIAEPDANGNLRAQVRKYYDLPERVAALQPSLVGKSVEELTEMVAERLHQAIDLRLRADVPVGVALSGGLDSSLIAATVSRKHDVVHGFTFGHPDHPESEGPLVQELAKQHHFQVHYVWPEVRDLIQGFWETLEAQDAPFLGGSQVGGYLVYQRARAAGIIVLLGGQGADEAFMGYRKFQLFRMQQLIHERSWMQAASFFISLFPAILAELRQGAGFWKYRHRYTGNQGSDTLLRLPEVEPPKIGATRGQPLWLRQARDFTAISLPTLLRYEDRNSMGNSIESRMPYVDHELVELGMALPDDLKLRAGYRKWVLRQIDKTALPDSIRIARYKTGFMVNQASWFAQGLGQALRTALHDREKKIRAWLPNEVKIDEAYSDAQFERRWAALTEALSLVWMADRSK